MYPSNFSITLRRFFIVLVSLACSHSFAAEPQSGLKRDVEILEVGCPLAYPSNSVALLDAQTRMTKGWSHIVNPEKADDFVGLSRAFDEYAVTANNHQPDENCGGELSFQATLVKKFHVWTNNHSNGIETDIAPIPVRDWDYVTILFRINGSSSVVPSVKQAQEHFTELSSSELAGLDQGQANMKLLFRAGEYEASYLFRLSPDHHFDRWLLARIPAEQFQYSKKVEYEHHHTSYKQSLNQWYETVLLKAETGSLKTVQHLNESLAPKNRLFKEIDISVYHLLIATNED